MDLLVALFNVALIFNITKKNNLKPNKPLRMWEGDFLPGETEPAKVTQEGRRLVEGDIIPTKRQFLNYRTARTFPSLYWPNGKISYAFNGASEPDRPVIEKALSEWEKQTCIKFTEVEKDVSVPHIVFKKLTGCNSHVGMDDTQNGQTISIGIGCNRFGIVAHEIGHAIGFHHEQSRPDRDRYIKMQLKNTKTVYHGDLGVKFRVETYPEPYDYNSIMHYPGMAFSVNGKNTIVTLNPFRQVEIGQREFLSFYDVKAANSMYNCSDHCQTRPRCLNEGYANKHCECSCPPEYDGSMCQTRLKDERKCGGVFRYGKTIRSPEYSPKNKDKLATCVWWFKAPRSYHVIINFKIFKISSPDRGNNICKWGTFEIRTTNKFDGNISCGTMLRNKTIESEDNWMILLYRDVFDADNKILAFVRFKKPIAKKTNISTTKILKTRIPKTRIPKTRIPKTRIPKTRIPKTRMPKTRTPKTRIPKKPIKKPRPNLDAVHTRHSWELKSFMWNK